MYALKASYDKPSRASTCSHGVRIVLEEPNYDSLLNFLLSDNLCCSVNPAGWLYGKRICMDCYKKVRKYATDLIMDWNISALGVIKWQKD